MIVFFGAAIVIGTIVMTLLCVLWWSWWLYPAWGWFIVPLGVPPISLWHFWGLLALLRAKVPKIEDKEPEPKPGKNWPQFIAECLIGPILMWALFWCLAHGVWR